MDSIQYSVTVVSVLHSVTTPALEEPKLVHIRSQDVLLYEHM